MKYYHRVRQTSINKINPSQRVDIDKKLQLNFPRFSFSLPPPSIFHYLRVQTPELQGIYIFFFPAVKISIRHRHDEANRGYSPGGISFHNLTTLLPFLSSPHTLISSALPAARFPAIATEPRRWPFRPAMWVAPAGKSTFHDFRLRPVSTRDAATLILATDSFYRPSLPRWTAITVIAISGIVILQLFWKGVGDGYRVLERSFLRAWKYREFFLKSKI